MTMLQAQEEADYDTSDYDREAYAATARDVQLFNDTEEIDYRRGYVSLYKATATATATYATCGGTFVVGCSNERCMECLPF